jgi:hypothetical protein
MFTGKFSSGYVEASRLEMKQREGEGERRTAAMTSLSGEVRREEREEDIGDRVFICVGEGGERGRMEG